MKILSRTLSILFLGLILTSTALSQDVGDYGSIASGNWGTLTTWAQWDGTGWNTVPTSQPSSSANVYIRTGDTVTVEASGKNCKNLYVESGALLKADQVQPTSNIRYIRVAGNYVMNNGNIGTEDNLNVISFEILKNTTFQGSGVSRICRIRPRTDSTNVNIIFDKDVLLTYTGGSGTGGVGMYSSNNAANDNITFTVNAGKTLTCVNYCYVSTSSSGTSTGTASTTFNINGNLVLQGPNTNLNLRVPSGKTSTLNVNGTANIGRNLNTYLTGNAVPTINVDGTLTIESGNCDLAAPSSLITGSGTVNINPGVTMLIGPDAGISSSGATGAVQTAFRNFSSEAKYSYVGIAAQSTGTGLPSIIDQLTINNAAGVQLTNSTTVTSGLTLTNGNLFTGVNALQVASGGSVTRTNGQVVGNLSKSVVTDTMAYSFEIGDALNYTPVWIDFTTLNTPGIITASTTQGVHPSFSGSGLDMSKKLNRYYTLSNNGTAFDNYTAGFTFVPTDIDPGADTANFAVRRYDAGTWTSPVTQNPLATSIEAAGLTGFGDFAVGEPGAAVSSVTDYFRTKASGDWNAASTWESSADNMTWIDATVTPYDTSNTITVRDGHTVAVTESVSVDQVVVTDNGTIVVNGSPVVFTVRDGAEDVDMLVFGTVKATGTAIASPGPYSVNAVGVVNFDSTSFYDHNQNGGAVPNSVWVPGSTIMFTALTGTAPANRNQNFSNIIYNSPDQTGTFNHGFTDALITGDITVTSTGTGRWQLCAPTAGSSASIVILGGITQTAGNFTSQGTSNANTTIVIHTYGDVVTTGGNFSVARGSQGGSGTTTWYLHGDLSMTNTATQNSNSAGAKFVFDTPLQISHLTLNNVTFTGGLPIEVADSTGLDIGTSTLRGSGIFTLNPYTGLLCGNEGGLDSALQNTGTITLSPGAEYIFNGDTPQITGVILPPVISLLLIDNNSGVMLSDSVEVSGYVILNSGDLDLNGNLLSLGTSGVLDEPAGSTVKGAGKISASRDLNAPSGLDPIGMGAWIHSAANLGLTTFERYHFTPSGGGNQGVSRVFNISPANNTGLDATLFFHYDESELNSIPEANLRLFSSQSGNDNSWLLRNGTVNAADNIVQLAGINSFSYWALGDVNNPIPVELTSFSASSDEFSLILNWTTASENQNRGWDIERKLKTDEEWSSIGFVEGNGTSAKIHNYTFRDAEAIEGTFNYRLKQTDYNGQYTYSQSVEVEVNNIPDDFALHQNFPNPFNPETVIRFEVPEDSYINLTVYNAIGEKIITLVDGQVNKGRYSNTFNAFNLPTGIYIYRLTSDKAVFTKKMMLIK